MDDVIQQTSRSPRTVFRCFLAADTEKKREDGRQLSAADWVNGSAQTVLVATHDGVCT